MSNIVSLCARSFSFYFSIRFVCWFSVTKKNYNFFVSSLHMCEIFGQQQFESNKKCFFSCEFYIERPIDEKIATNHEIDLIRIRISVKFSIGISYFCSFQFRVENTLYHSLFAPMHQTQQSNNLYEKAKIC